MIYYDRNPIYVIGDIHGEFRHLLYQIKKLNLSNCSIIVAGDCGIGFNKFGYYVTEFNKINDYIIPRDINIYFIRGNHDDPHYFNTQYANGNIQCLDDYSIIRNNDRTILCIGGAISIDRIDRIEYDKRNQRKKNKKTYWDDEGVVYDKNIIKLIKNNFNVNTIISHSSPDFCYPFIKGFDKEVLAIDKSLESDLNEERKTLTTIYNDFSDTLDTWVYGHFHASNKDFIIDKKFICLDTLSNVTYDNKLDIYSL